MSKIYSILLAMIFVLSIGTVFAETTVQQIQSPIYTDEIGRAHFLGRGGYSTVRKMQMNEAQADFVNDADLKFSNKKSESEATLNTSKEEVVSKVEDVKTKIETSSKEVETDITKVIKDRTDVPVASKTKASFTSEERKMDPSASFGKGATYLPGSGVNESKTIYTDEIGRLHFFGKGNLIKE